MGGLEPEPTAPLPEAPQLPSRRGSELLSGLVLLPEQRIKAFSSEQLEWLVKHWLAERTDNRYARVRVVAGPGDRGRDVIGFEGETAEDPWDNYQCKQYEKKLEPADIYGEIGKLVYWATNGAFSIPRAYTFVAPLGCGASGRALLDNPEQLRAGLGKTWDKYCRKLCPFDEIEQSLTDFAFPTLDVATGGEIVEDLKGTPIYAVLFGGGLTKPRPPVTPPPDAIAATELPYVGALVDAYDDHSNQPIGTPQIAFAHETYGDHLRTSRREFYCAESLREFSKDVLVAPDDFGSLQEQIADGIWYTVARDFPSGYDRVLAVCQHATTVQVDDHALAGDLRPSDRAGMCHQLANDGRVVWKRT
jgi:hypothetical protein